MTVISDYTTEFVDTVEDMELLNEIRPSNQIILVNLLHFWNRWECKTR